jgi:hypothetical protein
MNLTGLASRLHARLPKTHSAFSLVIVGVFDWLNQGAFAPFYTLPVALSALSGELSASLRRAVPWPWTGERGGASGYFSGK